MASATYEQPGAEMLELLERTIEECHERLLDADVRVQLLVARGPTDGDGELVGPALKHHGIAALGLTKINSLKHRVAGLGDAEILIDGDAWEDMSDRRRVALLDHELTHIEVVYEVRRKRKKKGDVEDAEPERTAGLEARPKLDSAGRPKLRIRHHDHTHGFFDEVARRHGSDSHEVEQARRFAAQTGELYFGQRGEQGNENAEDRRRSRSRFARVRRFGERRPSPRNHD